MNFRAEFLKKKRDEGWISEKYLNDDIGAPTFEVVFYNEADGKYYATEYYNDSDHGIDSYDCSAGQLFECHEVEKKEVTTVIWKKVKNG